MVDHNLRFQYKHFQFYNLIYRLFIWILFLSKFRSKLKIHFLNFPEIFQRGEICKWSSSNQATGGATSAIRRYNIGTVYNGTSRASTWSALPYPVPTATALSIPKILSRPTSANTIEIFKRLLSSETVWRTFNRRYYTWYFIEK